MKWIDASRQDGQTIALAVNAQGDLLMRSNGVETELGKPAQFQARMGEKRRFAEVNLPGIGVLRTIEVDAIDAWFAHLDLSGERSKKRLSASTIGWSILGTIALAIVLLFWLGLPWLARIAAENMPVEWEKSLASGTLASLASDGFKPTQISAEAQTRYRALFAKIAAQVQYGNPITLEFRSWTDPNAFAIPGGTVVVTDQMLKLMSSDDEFTAVMAHEVGHLEQRHGIRSVLQQGGVWLVVSLLVGDSSGLSAIATALPATLVDSAYSRDFEREADEYAFARLKEMQVSPKAFASLMRKMQAQSEQGSPGALKYFSSHPPTNERIEAAEQAAQ
jgi:Zn-dependent protease with chaperone function